MGWCPRLNFANSGNVLAHMQTLGHPGIIGAVGTSPSPFILGLNGKQLVTCVDLFSLVRGKATNRLVILPFGNP